MESNYYKIKLYKKEDYISTKKCSLYYRYCNVYHFLQLQLHSRRSWGTFGTDENTLKIFPASDLLNTFSARTDCLRSCTRYSTIPSNTSCIACRCTWTLCRLRATEVCRGCPRPWAPTRNIYTISTQVISGAGVEALSANCHMECCTTTAAQMTEAAASD